MTSNLDVLGGINDGAAYKAPCAAATTGDLTGALIGLRVVDGYQTVSGDRVLVWKNTDQTTNGIYVAQGGAWTLASDFSNSSAVVEGTQVLVTNGTAYGGNVFYVTTQGNITIGVSNISFALVKVDVQIANLPTTNPGDGTGVVWNNGGFVCVA